MGTIRSFPVLLNERGQESIFFTLFVYLFTHSLTYLLVLFIIRAVRIDMHQKKSLVNGLSFYPIIVTFYFVKGPRKQTSCLLALHVYIITAINIAKSMLLFLSNKLALWELNQD